MRGATAVFSGIALALDCISCFFSLVVTGFFAYTITDVFGNAPWYIDLGVAFAVVCFLVLLATSILGCTTCCCAPVGKTQVLYLTKAGLDAFACVLTLISAAINTGESPFSLGNYLDTCNSWDGFNGACSFGVGIVLLWTTFCLLVISCVLHGLASVGARPSKVGGDQPATPAAEAV